MESVAIWNQRLFSFDVTPYLTERTYGPGEFILREGALPMHLYFLIQGRAKIFLNHKNGKVSLIDFPSAPDLIGDMELIGARKDALNVQAVTACRFRVLDAQRCRDRLLEDPRFLWFLCRHIAGRSARHTENFTRLQAYPLRNQLADFLLLAADSGFYRERHTEVAEYLGVSYRHLLYVLAQFRQEGLVAREGNGYRLVNEGALKALAAELS